MKLSSLETGLITPVKHINNTMQYVGSALHLQACRFARFSAYQWLKCVHSVLHLKEKAGSDVLVLGKNRNYRIKLQLQYFGTKNFEQSTFRSNKVPIPKL